MLKKIRLTKLQLYYVISTCLAVVYAFFVANSAVFQSDWAALYLFFDEVMRLGNISSYYMPPTPALFQVLAYMLPLYLLFGLSNATFYSVIFLQTMVNILALAVLLVLLFPVRKNRFPKVALFVLGLTLTGPLLQIIDAVMFRKDIPLLLLALWYLFKMVEVGSLRTLRSKIFTALCVVFLIMQSFGDPYVMYMMLVPLLMANVVYVFCKRPHPVRTLWLSVIAVGSVVVAMILRWLTAQYVFHLYSGISAVGGPRYILPSLLWFLGDIDSMMPFFAVFAPPSFSLSYLLAVINFLVLLLMTVMIFYVLRLSFVKAHQFVFFLATLPILSSGVYIATHKPAEHMTRYHVLTAFVVYLIVGYGLVHAQRLGERTRTWLWGVLAVSLVFQSVIFSRQLYQQLTNLTENLQIDQDAELIESLAKHNLTKGYGGYWDASSVTFVTANERRVRPVKCFGGEVLPHYWFSFSQWYEADPSIDRTFLYVRVGEESFTADCRAEDLRLQFGPESELIVLGPGKYLYVWEYDIAVKFNRKNLDESLLFTADGMSQRFQNLRNKLER